jgi:hypothetical protein
VTLQDSDMQVLPINPVLVGILRGQITIADIKKTLNG